KLSGRTINTVEDLVKALQDGVIKPSQVPLDYVFVKTGERVILNTRTSVALERAGIARSKWWGINRTGVDVPDLPGTTFDNLARSQTKNNKLTIEGTPDIPK